MNFILVVIHSCVLRSVHIGLLWCGILHGLRRLLTVVSLLLRGLLSTVVLLLLIVVGCPIVVVLRIHCMSLFNIFIIIRLLKILNRENLF